MLKRIVVDTALNSGGAEYQNFGDVAMLQVAVKRLQTLWPSASIEVLTESPDNLRKYCPGAKPLTRAGRNRWIGDSFLLGRFHKLLPRLISSRLSGFAKTLEQKWPLLLNAMVRLRLRIRDDENIGPDLMAFLEAMGNADLFVVCGAGGFADDCREWNMTTLAAMETAIQREIPVAMFGQAIGPLNDLDVLHKMKSILPQINLITLRGGRDGLDLLKSLGVDTSQIETTGDEAIELAYEARSEIPGNGLGVNLRIASYAGIDNDFIPKIRPVLLKFVKLHNVPIVSVPIAFHQRANDHETFRQLMVGFDAQSDGGVSLDTPLKVIKQAGTCRVVVTSAYHAAVFALAQGIPVVCLSNSPYYAAKFLGLEDQFGLGCETIFLSEPDALINLSAAIERAWQSSEKVRLPLQKAALRQIELSRRSYERVVSL